MKEYHFKCKKCGVDLGGASGNPKSIRVKTGVDLGEFYDGFPKIRIDCEVQLGKPAADDGRQLPNVTAKDGREDAGPISVEGVCPNCGAAFRRVVPP